MHIKPLPTLLPALLPALTLALALPTTPPIPHELTKSLLSRAPPGAHAVLKSVTTSGTGCPGNSASFVLGTDNGATVGFDNLIVDGSEVDRTKRCVITVDLQLDSGWRYTVNKGSSVRGYAVGTGGSYEVVYRVGGSTSEVSNAIPPDTVGGNYVVSSTSAGAVSAYGGGVASIDILLKLVPGGTQDEIVTIDSLDVEFEYST